MPEIIERDLADLIRATLRVEAEAAEVATGVSPERLTARWRIRQDRRRRRPFVLLGVAAVLIVPLLLLAVTALAPPPVRGTLALLMRNEGPVGHAVATIVAVTADGRERRLATFPDTILPPGGRSWSGGATDSGRIALGFDYDDPVGLGEGFALLDLAHPDAPAVLVQDPQLGIGPGSYAWGPDGRFATWLNDGTILIVDPVSGESRSIRPDDPTAGWGLWWTADGSGFVSFAFTGPDEDTPDPRVFSSTDGSDLGSVVPALYPRPWGRGMSPDGATLDVCRSFDGVFCPGEPDGAVVLRRPDGTMTTVYRDGLPDARVRDAAFTADADSAWVLGDRQTDERTLVLGRATDSDNVDTVAEVNALPGMGRASIDGVAPDDSLVVLSASMPPDSLRAIVMPTDGSGATYHEGLLVGFASAGQVDTWPGGTWAEVPGIEPPAHGALPDALSLDQAYVDGPVLLTLDGTGEPGGVGQTTTTGEVTITEGIGLAAACIGPSTMTISYRIPPDSAMAETLIVDCLVGESSGEASPLETAKEPVPISVTADARTTWQLVVYDPRPWKSRGPQDG